MIAAFEWLAAKIGALLFRWIDYAPVPVWESDLRVETPTPDEMPTPVPAPTDERRPRLPRRHIARTLSSLLDNIEDIFTSLTRRTATNSWNHVQMRTALKRLGPHVPYPRTKEENAAEDAKIERAVELGYATVEIKPDTTFSALMFVAYNLGDKSGPDAEGHNWLWADFTYAQRLAKLPWHAERLTGDAYECGMAYRCMSGKLWWTNFYAVVDHATGIVRACREWRKEPVRVTDGEYTRVVWGLAPMANRNDDHWGTTEKAKNGVLAQLFADAFTFWHDKDNMWSVSVRRDKRRVTFCIPPAHTKLYFRDRAKTALTAAGKRRPIIHYVHPFEREVSPGKLVAVREHIRGLRTFYWKGFECAVTAPAFHRWTTQSFDAPTHNETDMVDEEKVIWMEDVAQALADVEDSQDGNAFHPRERTYRPQQIAGKQS